MKRMSACTILFCSFALATTGCVDSTSEDAGRVDDWTWDDPSLKSRTSPNREKRASADVEDGQIELILGEVGGDHPVDIWVHYTEKIPEPNDGKWDMNWIDDETFAFQHSDLGTKVWKVEGVNPVTVTVNADWNGSAKD